MFKNKVLALLMCIFVFSTAMISNAYGLKSKELATTKKAIESRVVEKILVTDGYVEQRSGDFITVIGEGDEGAYNEIILNIDDKTEIVDTLGNKLNKDHIKEGTVVEVAYDAKFTESVIPFATAQIIIIKDGIGRSGDVLEIKKSSNNEDAFYLTIGKNKENYEDQYVLIIGENTEIVDKDGDELSINDIEEGMKIVGIHRIISTMSIPPQFKAFKIIVMEDINQDKQIVEGMVDYISYISNQNDINGDKKVFLSIFRKGEIDNTYGNINVFIDERTKILDEDGVRVSVEKIKRGSIIEVINYRKLTENKDEAPYIEKVIIKNSKGIRGNIIKINKAGKVAHVFVQENNKTSSYFEMKLIIGENDEISDIKGNKLSIHDLKKGMIIVGIYSVSSSLSLPSESSEYKIIVMNEIKETKHVVEGMIYKVINEDYNGYINGEMIEEINLISVVGEGIRENTPDFIQLYINYHTEIVNEQGNKLDLDDIKEGLAVEVIFGQNFKNWDRPVGTAEKIIIKNALGVKGEIINTDDNAYIEIKKSDNYYDNITLKINDDTKIVDLDGNELSKYDLSKGAEVIGIHSLAITSSLPYESLAYKIIVLKKGEVEDKHIIGGMIYKFSNNDKKKISVVGEALTKNAPKFVDLYINNDTEIVNEQGHKLDLDHIKEGAVVEAIFGKRLTKSSIPIGTAEKIIIKNAVGVKGEISNTNNEKSNIEIKRTDNYYDSIILKINDDTEIVDVNGKELSKEKLTKGAKIVVIHSLVTTKSIPPQSVAYKIILLEKAEVENKHVVEGVIYKVRNYYKMRISIIGEAVTEKAPNLVDLYIDNDTEIVNEQGHRLDLEDIKEGTVVKAIFGQRLIKSDIPIGTAEKIVIKNASGVKGEIIDTNYDRTFIEIQKLDESYENIILKINNNTEIIDINGEELSKDDLSEGVTVIGIHSLETTSSWPPQSLAYKIIVLKQNNDDYDDDDNHEY